MAAGFKYQHEGCVKVHTCVAYLGLLMSPSSYKHEDWYVFIKHNGKKCFYLFIFSWANSLYTISKCTPCRKNFQWYTNIQHVMLYFNLICNENPIQRLSEEVHQLLKLMCTCNISDLVTTTNTTIQYDKQISVHFWYLPLFSFIYQRHPMILFLNMVINNNKVWLVTKFMIYC